MRLLSTIHHYQFLVVICELNFEWKSQTSGHCYFVFLALAQLSVFLFFPTQYPKKNTCNPSRLIYRTNMTGI